MVLISDTPGISMHREEYKGALFIFQIFSVVVFLFGCMIVSSLFSTILAGQVKQIGILKSMSAQTKEIIKVYLSAALLLIVGNLLISLPLSYFAMKSLSAFFLSIGNMKIHNFDIPISMMFIVCILIIIIPLMLAFLLICKGLSITVKEALNNLNSSVQIVKKDRITAWFGNKVSRPILLSIRGSMENRGRFVMNVTMMTLGGLMFVGVVSSIISINMALSKSINAQKYDYQVVMSI